MNKKNVVKDFVHVAGPLGVTHLLMLSKTEMGTYLVCICKIIIVIIVCVCVKS